MLIICVCDFWNKCTYMLLESNNKSIKLEKLSTRPWRSTQHQEEERSNTTQPIDTRLQFSNDTRSSNGNSCSRNSKNNSSTPCKTLRRLRFPIDGITAFYLLREIQEFTKFRQRLFENPALREMELLWLQLEPPPREIIDYKWNHMIAHSLWEKIEVDYLMSWLSTLGGGYSALGEQFTSCAQTAGKISLRQLAIGMRLGDPFLQARCKLYYSISLIQTGRLRTAKHIVREQYKFAKKVKEYDGRLVKMCKGIWMRVQYEYGLRIKEKLRKKELQAAGDSET